MTVFNPVGKPFTIRTVSTTDATATSLVDEPLPDNSVSLFVAHITARRTNGADQAGYIRRTVVHREAGGGAAIINPIDTELTRETTGPWDATIDVSGNNVRVRVTGTAGHNINWRCEFFTVRAE